MAVLRQANPVSPELVKNEIKRVRAGTLSAIRHLAHVRSDDGELTRVVTYAMLRKYRVYLVYFIGPVDGKNKDGESLS